MKSVYADRTTSTEYLGDPRSFLISEMETGGISSGIEARTFIDITTADKIRGRHAGTCMMSTDYDALLRGVVRSNETIAFSSDDDPTALVGSGPMQMSSASPLFFGGSTFDEDFQGVDLLTFAKEHNSTLNFPQKVRGIKKGF